MAKISRSDDPRYVQIVDRGVREYVHDQAALSDELMSLLATDDELTRTRLSAMVGARGALVERVLTDPMSSGRVTQIRQLGLRGQSCYFWSVADAPEASVRANATAILGAFQRKSAGCV